MLPNMYAYKRNIKQGNILLSFNFIKIGSKFASNRLKNKLIKTVFHKCTIIVALIKQRFYFSR